MVIGHEFTHGFDTEGRQFDKNGNRVRWWTNKTIDAFEEQKKCIVNQYSNYTVTQVDMQVHSAAFLFLLNTIVFDYFVLG